MFIKKRKRIISKDLEVAKIPNRDIKSKYYSVTYQYLKDCIMKCKTY